MRRFSAELVVVCSNGGSDAAVRQAGLAGRLFTTLPDALSHFEVFSSLLW